MATENQSQPAANDTPSVPFYLNRPLLISIGAAVLLFVLILSLLLSSQSSATSAPQVQVSVSPRWPRRDCCRK
ncbi:MAG: hypothetical protein HC876_14730 [Chloroflexaceae bacterium]|nr:hypothetical protein [Chloroflexaceae bacterium]